MVKIESTLTKLHNTGAKFLRKMTVTKKPAAVGWEKYSWMWQGYHIRYTVVGTGQPLLLLHGFGASIGHWRNNISVLAAQGYQVYAIDLLGFGDSDKPALDYSLHLWQELLCDFISDRIQQPTVFVGNSIGALLSLMMAADYPEHTAGVVLVNAAGGLNHRPQELNLPLRVVMGTFSKVTQAPVIGPMVFHQIRQRHRIRRTLYQVYANPEAVTEELVDLLYQPSCHEGAQKVFASILNAPAGPHPSELLPKVDCPMLVLWGENDPWTPISGSAIYQKLAQEKDPVDFFSIPQAGHCPHDEQPDTVNGYIVDWLAAHFA